MPILEGHDWREGVERAWDMLAALSHEDICRDAKAEFDEADSCYILPFFHDRVHIFPEERRFWSDNASVDNILTEHGHLSWLSILWYLAGAKDAPLSESLINPREVAGGVIFTGGAHVLPLDDLVEKYGGDTAGFIEKGKSLGGKQIDHADAAIRLLPFPRIPVILLIWKQDEEFPARADILFDATCQLHLPADIIWSTAMLSILVML